MKYFKRSARDGVFSNRWLAEHRTILPSCANLLINPLTALFSPRSSLDISLTDFLPRRQHFQSLAQVRRERSGFLCSLCFKLSHRAQPPPVRKVCSFKARKFSDLVEEREVKDENCAIAARICKSKKGGQHQQLRLQTGKLCNQSGIEIARRLRSANSVQRK